MIKRTIILVLSVLFGYQIGYSFSIYGEIENAKVLSIPYKDTSFSESCSENIDSAKINNAVGLLMVGNVSAFSDAMCKLLPKSDIVIEDASITHENRERIKNWVMNLEQKSLYKDVLSDSLNSILQKRVIPFIVKEATLQKKNPKKVSIDYINQWGEYLSKTTSEESVKLTDLYLSNKSSIKSVFSSYYKNEIDTSFSTFMKPNVIWYDTDHESLFKAPDSLDIQDFITDSMRVDSSAVGSQKALLDDIVDYDAKDSTVYDFVNNKIFLYGDGIVNYQDIELKADYIELSMDSSYVVAHGTPCDTTDSVIGKPVFKQASQEFVSDKIKYNFETKKGLVYGVVTEQQGGFVNSKRTKMVNDSTFCLVNGQYTTCDAEHPHFYLEMTKAKVISNKTIVTGPAYMVVEDLPIYFAVIPFGFFPNSSSYSSGILMPSYGEETQRGMFLRDLGYYWAAGPYFDLAVRGDFYTKGSKGLKVHSNYKVRYKFGGSFDFQYFKNVYGEKGLFEGPDAYRESKDFSIKWSHQQDSKANPNFSFTATVDYSTSSFDENNSYDMNDYMTNSKSSSIAISKVWPRTPFQMDASLRHSQNSRDSTINLLIPDVQVSMNRIYPFRKKISAGKPKFYEKIGLNYSMNLSNQIYCKEDELFEKNIFRDWDNGVQHQASISTSFNLLRYLAISPSANYNERWYSKEIHQEYNNETNEVEKDTLYKFSRDYDYSVSMSLTTKLYGMFLPKKTDGYFRGLRHLMTPSVSFSYTPDFASESKGIYSQYTRVNTDSEGNQTSTIVPYSFHEGLLYGTAPVEQSGSIGFSLDNVLEMKVANTKDTTGTEKDRKIPLLEQFNISGSYNLVADSMNLSTISMRGRTKVSGIDVNFSATFDPYYFDTNAQGGSGARVNRFEVSETGKLARLTQASLAFGLNFQSKESKEEEEKTDKDEQNEQDQLNAYEMEQEGKVLPGEFPEYANFSVPWSLDLNYSFSYSRQRPDQDASIQQTVDVNGQLNLTPKWKLTFMTGYDFQAKEISLTQFSLYRDLHCFQMSFDMVPFGYRQSYSFTIRANASVLKDLKLDKRDAWQDNGNQIF